MKSLIAEFGYEGYGRFWVLNEKIAESSGVVLDISRKVNRLDLAQDLGLTGDKLDEFLSFLSDPEIGLISFVEGKISTDRVGGDYRLVVSKRKRDRTRREGQSDDLTENSEREAIVSENGKIAGEIDVFQGGPSAKDQENRIEEKREEEKRIPSGSAASGPEAEPPGEAEKSPPAVESKKPEYPPPRPKPPPLREREPVNDLERVEKAYLRNWDALYRQGRVKTPDPVVNWNQTRKLLKRHFEKLKPEQIILALENGMADTFVMSGGYSLGVALSASVLNRLINAGQGPGPPPALEGKKSLRGLSRW
jgi:hypothetical protein